MDALQIVIIILMFGYLGYIIFERVYHHEIRKDFKHIIHVNGIRGKSTVCRLIDAGLRECGYKVYTKTTGTLPMIINTDNVEVPIKRLGKANIREQLKIMRKAKKAGADVLVIECMAVNPDLQEISQQQILQADIVVVTNVRLDHIGQMGENELDIANAFARTIPLNGTFIIGDNQYIDLYQKHVRTRQTKIKIAKNAEIENIQETFETFPENINISLAIAKELDLPQKAFIEGMKKYHHDFGAYRTISTADTVFINGFASNDATSTLMLYQHMIKKYDSNDITILFNSRNDRPSRTFQFIEMFNSIDIKKIIITGSNLHYVKKKLSQSNKCEVMVLKKFDELLDEKIIFAMGNIGGIGMEIVKYFIDMEEK